MEHIELIIAQAKKIKGEQWFWFCAWLVIVVGGLWGFFWSMTGPARMML